MPFIGNSVPSPGKWLYCNGSTFDANIYKDLFVILGNSNITPDLRGVFLRGYADDSQIDKGRQLNNL